MKERLEERIARFHKSASGNVDATNARDLLRERAAIKNLIDKETQADVTISNIHLFEEARTIYWAKAKKVLSATG